MGTRGRNEQRALLTIFSTAKPFEGRAAMVQRNAIESWTLLRPRPEVILFGNEPGVADICEELGLIHVASVGRSEFGTPLIPSMFRQAQQQARGELLCYANCDIVLTNDFIDALWSLLAWQGQRRFLAVGARSNLWVNEPIDFSPDWESSLRQAIRQGGEIDGPWALDYFVFSRGLYRRIPPFVVGRPDWDNWMVYSARRARARVVDLTPTVTVIHQRHDYAHHPLGRSGVYSGDEAQHNMELASGPLPGQTPAEFGLLDVTHVATREGIQRSWRVRGLIPWVWHELIHLPTYYPILIPPARFAHSLCRTFRTDRSREERFLS